MWGPFDAYFYRRKAKEQTSQNAADKPEAIELLPAEHQDGPRAKRTSARALTEEECKTVLDLLCSERFADKARAEVFAELLDEEVYVCSVSTMYRLLRQSHAVRERRNVLRHPVYKRPELLATEPNQVWTWDITKLKGPGKWTYYYLYVVMDVFSRYVVGWQIAYRESAEIAEQLILNVCLKQDIQRGRLTIHADRGAAMTSKAVAQLLSDLGVEKTHSRPHVSNDNPYSEAHFKTLKYRPDFPETFGCLEDARSFCRDFFDWYNLEHRHSGIAMLTPATVHDGKAERTIAKRQSALSAAYAANPQRFVNHAPRHAPLPEAAWINPPDNTGAGAETTDASLL
jgi:putative transposase